MTTSLLARRVEKLEAAIPVCSCSRFSVQLLRAGEEPKPFASCPRCKDKPGRVLLVIGGIRPGPEGGGIP